jgi:hypothetical protein
MTVTYAQAARQTELNDYAAQFGAASQLAIFSGVAPTDVDTAFSGNAIIGALPFSATPFGTASAAKPIVITANTLTQTNAYGTAAATFFRCYAQGTSGITGAGFVVGNVYSVETPGTSTLANYQAIGLNAGITALAAGQLFVATGTTLTGNGTAYLMTPLEQGTIGTTGSDLNLNTTAIVAGGPIAITGYTRQM